MPGFVGAEMPVCIYLWEPCLRELRKLAVVESTAGFAVVGSAAFQLDVVVRPGGKAGMVEVVSQRNAAESAGVLLLALWVTEVVAQIVQAASDEESCPEPILGPELTLINSFHP
jgi:hypothetical protein